MVKIWSLDQNKIALIASMQVIGGGDASAIISRLEQIDCSKVLESKEDAEIYFGDLPIMSEVVSMPSSIFSGDLFPDITFYPNSGYQTISSRDENGNVVYVKENIDTQKLFAVIDYQSQYCGEMKKVKKFLFN